MASPAPNSGAAASLERQDSRHRRQSKAEDEQSNPTNDSPTEESILVCEVSNLASPQDEPTWKIIYDSTRDSTGTGQDRSRPEVPTLAAAAAAALPAAQADALQQPSRPHPHGLRRRTLAAAAEDTHPEDPQATAEEADAEEATAAAQATATAEAGCQSFVFSPPTVQQAPQ